MAMFTEKGQGPLDSEAGLSIIGTGMRVVGDITADGVVKIEGMVVGTVRAGRQVLVGKGGEVEGDVISMRSSARILPRTSPPMIASREITSPSTSPPFPTRTSRPPRPVPPTAPSILTT